MRETTSCDERNDVSLGGAEVRRYEGTRIVSRYEVRGTRYEDSDEELIEVTQTRIMGTVLK